MDSGDAIKDRKIAEAGRIADEGLSRETVFDKRESLVRSRVRGCLLLGKVVVVFHYKMVAH